MYCSGLTEILYLAEHHGYRFCPAAGWDWQGDWDKGKQPLASIHTATADPAQLHAWAAKYRNCNWLFVPGDAQTVLDVDPRHGGDVLLRELEAAHGPLPVTAVAVTGRGDGGRHLHFTCPPGLSFSQDICGNAGLTLATGGKRGFVVPPCRHALGGQYRWERATWDVSLAPVPDWLIELAAKPHPVRHCIPPARPGRYNDVHLGRGQRVGGSPRRGEEQPARHACAFAGPGVGAGAGRGGVGTGSPRLGGSV